MHPLSFTPVQRIYFTMQPCNHTFNGSISLIYHFTPFIGKPEMSDDLRNE